MHKTIQDLIDGMNIEAKGRLAAEILNQTNGFPPPVADVFFAALDDDTHDSVCDLASDQPNR